MQDGAEPACVSRTGDDHPGTDVTPVSDGCGTARPIDPLTAASRTAGITTIDDLSRRHDRACFLIVGQGALRRVELADKAEHHIGSDPASDIRLADPAVAQLHAILKIGPDGQFTIVPVSLDCPVLVNLRFVEGASELADGDIVSIGAMTLTFHDAPHPLQRDALDLTAFHEHLDRWLTHSATDGQPAVVSLGLAGNRGGDPGRRVLDELSTVLGDEKPLVGTDGSAHLVVAFRFLGMAREVICERLCDSVRKAVPVDAAGFALYPDDAVDAAGLVDAARRAMRPFVQPGVGNARPVVRTLLVAGHSVHVLDPAMRRLFDSVRSLSATDLPVLIQGETGVGKELVAHALHEWSPRRDKPLVTVNCAAIADTLVENELFGHEPGAFTGAGQAKPGLLEVAEGGTVFLDEIGECSPQIQAKLLRVLETRRVSRLGSVKERRIDVRWVAATNRDLKHEVAERRFRSDLLFRLNTAPIQVLPLRSRRTEIPLLARTFLEAACVRLGRPIPALSLAATRRLIEYRWPGNVRELRGLMEYLAATCDGSEVGERLLPPEILSFASSPRGGTRAGDSPARALEARPAVVTDWADYVGLYNEVRRLEEQRIRDALRATGWVRIEAAKLLGIPLRTFHTKMKGFGIRDVPDAS